MTKQNPVTGATMPDDMTLEQRVAALETQNMILVEMINKLVDALNKNSEMGAGLLQALGLVAQPEEGKLNFRLLIPKEGPIGFLAGALRDIMMIRKKLDDRKIVVAQSIPGAKI